LQAIREKVAQLENSLSYKRNLTREAVNKKMVWGQRSGSIKQEIEAARQELQKLEGAYEECFHDLVH
jgi:hypothetical protein